MDIEVTMLAFSNAISHQIHKASFLKFLFIHWVVHTNQYRPFQVCVAGQYAQYNIDNVPVKDLALWLKKWWRAGRFLKAFQEPVFTPHQKINRLLRRPWKLKIKDIKKLLGIRAGESDIKPSLLFMMSFSFYGGSKGWKLKADMGSRFGGNLPYTTVHKSAPLISGITLLLTRASLSFWKVISVRRAVPLNVYGCRSCLGLGPAL